MIIHLLYIIAMSSLVYSSYKLGKNDFNTHYWKDKQKQVRREKYKLVIAMAIILIVYYLKK